MKTPQMCKQEPNKAQVEKSLTELNWWDVAACGICVRRPHLYAVKQQGMSSELLRCKTRSRKYVTFLSMYG